MRHLWCLFLMFSLATSLSRVDFRIVFKSEWVREYSPRHQLMVNGSHPVLMLTGLKNRTCHRCPNLQHLDIEYNFFMTQERYLLTLGDKWEFVARASIVHTCFLLKSDFVCDTEVVTNRGHLTIHRSNNTVFGHGNFMHLLDSMNVPGLQYLIENREAIRIRWREQLYVMKKYAQPSHVWVTLIRDSLRNFVGCSAYCSSPFPIAVSLASKTGQTVYGKEYWSFISVNASVQSNDLNLNYCRIESIVGWSVAVTHIPEGYWTMRLLEHDRRQELNSWMDETLIVKPPHRQTVVTETSLFDMDGTERVLSVWTIFCASTIVVIAIATCLAAFVTICREYVDGERNVRRARDLTENGVEYMRF